MKKIILFSIVFIFIPFVFTWASPIDTLRQYYEADKNEDIDKMMSLTDFSSVDSSELKEFMSETRKTLEALAEIFNTKYYQISNEEAVIDGDNAIVYYRLKTELEDSSGESMVMDKDFVAVMLNSGDWKIVYTQPKDTFEHNLLVRESLVSLGESYTQEIDFDEFLEDKGRDWADYIKYLYLVLGFVGVLIILKLLKKMNFKFILAIIFVILAIAVWWFLKDSIVKKDAVYTNDNSVNLESVKASSVLPPEGNYTYAPENTIDGSNETSWVEGTDGSGIGEWIKFIYSGNKKISSMTIMPGYASSHDIYFKNNRVKKLELEFSNGKKQTFSLPDEMKTNQLNFDLVETNYVKLTILEVYPGTLYNDTAIAEITFK